MADRAFISDNLIGEVGVLIEFYFIGLIFERYAITSDEDNSQIKFILFLSFKNK